MEYLFVLAGAFALLFSVLLIFSRGRESQQQHWIFAVLSLLVAVSSYYVFLMYKKNGVYYEPYFSEINYAIPLLYGVLLWFYTRALINKKLRMGWLVNVTNTLAFLLFYVGVGAVCVLVVVIAWKARSASRCRYILVSHSTKICCGSCGSADRPR